MGVCFLERARRVCAGQMSASLMCCWIIASFLETPAGSNLPPPECQYSLTWRIQDGEVERNLKCGWDSLQKSCPRNAGGWILNRQPFVKGPKILVRCFLGGLRFQRRQVLGKSLLSEEKQIYFYFVVFILILYLSRGRSGMGEMEWVIDGLQNSSANRLGESNSCSK